MCAEQTERHAAALIAPWDIRLWLAADDTLDERVGVDAWMLRTERTVERYLLWNTPNLITVQVQEIRWR